MSEQDTLHDGRNLPIFIHSTIDDMTDLTPNEMRVYMHLARRTNKDSGKAWPSYQSIGDHCFSSVFDNKATRRSVARQAVAKLIEVGLIAKEERKADNGSNQSNHYILLDPVPIAPPVPIKHSPVPIAPPVPIKHSPVPIAPPVPIKPQRYYSEDTPCKGTNTEKEINNDDDGLTPQAVRKLFEESGIYTTEHDFIPKVAQMIDSHGAEKVLRGIAKVEEIHRNKMDGGKQGIWSPGEYLAKILISEEASNGKVKRIMPKSNDAEMKRMEAMGL